jgi:hypothetical protein
MYVVFDFDGVIADTEGYIRQAYTLAGVTPPDDILNYEDRNWIDLQASVSVSVIKARKNEHYLRLLTEHPPNVLAPFYVAREFLGYGHTPVLLSGAQDDQLEAFYRWHARRWPFFMTIGNHRQQAKMRWLAAQYSRTGMGGVYVDDQPLRYDISRGWRYIQYRGQHQQELMEEIKCAFVSVLSAVE